MWTTNMCVLHRIFHISSAMFINESSFVKSVSDLDLLLLIASTRQWRLWEKGDCCTTCFLRSSSFQKIFLLLKLFLWKFKNHRRFLRISLKRHELLNSYEKQISATLSWFLSSQASLIHVLNVFWDWRFQSIFFLFRNFKIVSKNNCFSAFQITFWLKSSHDL